jgi:4-hydroxybenzoate polyprenyltransferase
MWLLLTYLALALLGNAIIYFIGLVVEQVWPVASLPLYLFMFFVVLGLAWFGAVKLTEPKRAAQS